MTAGLAVGCAAVAAWLWVAGPPSPPRRRPRTGPLVGLGLLGVAGSVGLVGQPRLLVLLGVTTAAAVAVLGLVRRRHHDREARRRRERVVELCEVLVAELTAGQPAPAALQHAATHWPFLGPVARVSASGGDVPRALRELAGEPGAGDLRILAAAWQVAHRTGHGLADAVDRVAIELRAAQRTHRVVTGELASARATARLVAVLPVFALLVGSGTGADPWAFLFGHPLGLACLTVGLGFEMAGWAWLEAIARSVERGR